MIVQAARIKEKKMPFIEVKTTVELTEDKKNELKTGLGKVITRIPNKTEAVTMIGLVGNYDLYLGGKHLDKGAYVEVKMYKSATTKEKADVNQGIFDLLKDCLDIDADNIYITFHEKSEWGVKGKLI
jgi:phenylpyruvate tautomerase PptA (4-oxalocrotonate tautomerase family)